MKTAIVPGTFDPVTEGHLSVIKYAAARYDKVLVAVMNNPSKSPICDPQTRVKLIQKCTCGIENVSVIYREGMLYELVKENEPSDIVKGIRNDSDLLYEKAMADYNKRFSGADTVYVLATDELKNVSSSLVREYAKAGKALGGFVPKQILEDVEQLYSK